MHGPGSEVFEIALPFRGDAFRVVYAAQVADESRFPAFISLVRCAAGELRHNNGDAGRYRE